MINNVVEYRIATPDDIPSLCDLLLQLFAQEQEFRPDRAAHQRGIKTIIANPELGTIFVARADQRLVGMVSLLYTVSTALGGKVALLEDMLVDASCQQQGIGSRLLSHALAVARNNNCLRISLLTDYDNQIAQHFYQQHGFVRSGMVTMRLLIDG